MKKSAFVLFVHAICFELIALFLVIPSASYLLNKPMEHLGFFALVVAVLALSWNMLFNAIFDRLQIKWGFKRTITVRVVHTVIFEMMLLSITIPFGAWWMNISLLASLLLNIGMVGFYFPYTFVFNVSFDYFYKRLNLKTNTA